MRTLQLHFISLHVVKLLSASGEHLVRQQAAHQPRNASIWGSPPACKRQRTHKKPEVMPPPAHSEPPTLDALACIHACILLPGWQHAAELLSPITPRRRRITRVNGGAASS